MPSVASDVVPTVPTARVASSREHNAEAPVSSMGGSADVSKAKVFSPEEKVEYRDQDGNLLNEDEVKSLMDGGEASFSTKYETKTLLVDEQGNQVLEDPQTETGSTAPAHPDTENVDPETAQEPEPQATDEPRAPAQAEVAPDASSTGEDEVDTGADAAAPASDLEVQPTE